MITLGPRAVDPRAGAWDDATGARTMDHQPAPWTWLDLLRALAFALGIVAACALLVGGGYYALGLAEQRQLLEAGWLSHHLRPIRPYRLGILALVLTVLLYGAALLGIRRYSIQKYRLPWSALYLRHAGWNRYLAMLTLYIPMQFGAGVIVAMQARAAGHALKNPQHGAIAHVVHYHWFNYVAFFLAAAVIAPVAEEIIFVGSSTASCASGYRPGRPYPSAPPCSRWPMACPC